MAATKGVVSLVSSQTLTAGSTYNGSSSSFTTSDYMTVSGTVINGSTGPTLPCQMIIYTSFDNSIFYAAYTLTAYTTASTTTTFTRSIDPAVQYIKVSFTGNTGQSVTIQAQCGYGTY